MTWLEWGALGELISGVGIIVSLIYVGIQIRQNTKATKVTTSHAFIHLQDQLASHIMDRKGFRAIYWKGLQGLSNLEGIESVAFLVWMIQVFRAWEAFWYQWQEGAFDDRLWRGWEAQLKDIFGYVGSRDAWSMRKHQLSKEFRDYVDQHVIDAESHPLYATSGGTA